MPAATQKPARGAAKPIDTLTLHRRILDRLGPAPVAEDQLLRDLDLPAATVAPALLFLELDGRVQRQPGGMLARS
jgi:DNA processing protein